MCITCYDRGSLDIPGLNKRRQRQSDRGLDSIRAVSFQSTARVNVRVLESMLIRFFSRTYTVGQGCLDTRDRCFALNSIIICINTVMCVVKAIPHKDNDHTELIMRIHIFCHYGFAFYSRREYLHDSHP